LYLLSDEDPMPKAPAKKNKKRWCGGHEGREHVPVTTKAKYSGGWQCGYRKQSWRFRGTVVGDGVVYSCWHEVTCEKCHKTLTYKSASCPDRVGAWDKYMKEKENT
jgi:hypothetical protein